MLKIPRCCYHPKFLPAAATVVALLLYGGLSVVMWTTFYFRSWDLGIFTQLVSKYAALQAPIVDIKGPGYNLWGDHFHPILMLLAPFYKIAPSAFTLLVAQAVLFSLSAWAVTSLAAERLGRRGGGLVAFGYIFSWGLLNAVTSEFHEIAFGVPLIAWGLVSWMRGHKIAAVICIGLLVFVKEDLGLMVVMFGIAVWMRNRKDIRIALGLIAWGGLWALLAIKVFLPAFSGEGTYEYTDNIATGAALTDGLSEKIGVIGFLILSAGVIGVRSEWMLLMIPTLLWRFTGSVFTYWSLDYHYSAVLMPIAALSLVDAARGHRVRYRILAPAITVAVVLAAMPYTRLDLFWEADEQRVDGAPLVAQASQYDSVVTDLRMLSHLVPVTHVYWRGTVGSAQPDAALLRPADLDERSVEKWAEVNLGGQWITVYSHAGYEIAVAED